MAIEPTYTFDSRTQREVLADLEATRKWVAHLSDQGMIGDPMRVLWLRLVGELDAAEMLGWEVLERSGGPASSVDASIAPLPLSAVIAAIRLAHVLQWKSEFELAHVLYARAIETLNAVPPRSEDSAYADYLCPFAYQHRARCYFDEGKYQEALATSQHAYELRIAAGVPEDQLLSSAGLIEAARARLI